MRAIAICLLVACSVPAKTPVGSQKYDDDKLWLCRPDLKTDPCRGDLSATEFLADGARVVRPNPTPAAAPKVDCFYVYPTVDLSLLPGNHTNFDEQQKIIEATLAQAAMFREACALYVPLYRQITIGTYFWGDKQREKRIEVAYSDIEAAFQQYMSRYNRGRKVVLIGHSQGAEMVVKLLQRRFDNDPAMREKLLVAMPIGGPLDVDSLTNIPPCKAPGQRGCAIGYHSYAAVNGRVTDWPWSKPKGARSLCVNPAADGAAYKRAYLPTARLADRDGITTAFVLLSDWYTGRCIDDGAHDYLEISEVRPGPVDLHGGKLAKAAGLHVLDMQFELGDLIDLVETKSAGL